MTHNHMKKGPSLENMLDGHRVQVDRTRDIQVVDTNKFKDLYDQYREFLEKEILSRGDFDAKAWARVRDRVKTVLDPSEINAFLQLTVTNEDYPTFLLNTSLFLSGLIQASYEDGNSFFDLNVKNLKPLEAVGAFLCKTRVHPYSVRAKGNVSTYFGIHSGDVKFYLDGDAGIFCGSNAQNSEFYIGGDAGISGCFGSQDCLFDFRGKVERIYLSNAKGSTVLISDRESFEGIRKRCDETVHAESLGYNEVYFVHPDKKRELLEVSEE